VKWSARQTKAGKQKTHRAPNAGRKKNREGSEKTRKSQRENSRKKHARKMGQGPMVEKGEKFRKQKQSGKYLMFALTGGVLKGRGNREGGCLWGEASLRIIQLEKKKGKKPE